MNKKIEQDVHSQFYLTTEQHIFCQAYGVVDVFIGFLILFGNRKKIANVVLIALTILEYLFGNEFQKRVSVGLLLLAFYRLILYVMLDKENKLLELENEICFRWKNKQVRNWLKISNFNRNIKEIIENFDGSMLKAFHEIKTRSSDYYYATLERITNFDIEDVIRFDVKFESLIRNSYVKEKEYVESFWFKK